MTPAGNAGSELSPRSGVVGLESWQNEVVMIALGPFDPDWVKTVVLMAALPPALNVFVLGRQYEAWVEPASGSVLLGTLLSVATLTTVMWLVQHGVLTKLVFG